MASQMMERRPTEAIDLNVATDAPDDTGMSVEDATPAATADNPIGGDKGDGRKTTARKPPRKSAAAKAATAKSAKKATKAPARRARTTKAAAKTPEAAESSATDTKQATETKSRRAPRKTSAKAKSTGKTAKTESAKAASEKGESPGNASSGTRKSKSATTRAAPAKTTSRKKPATRKKKTAAKKPAVDAVPAAGTKHDEVKVEAPAAPAPEKPAPTKTEPAKPEPVAAKPAQPEWAAPKPAKPEPAPAAVAPKAPIPKVDAPPLSPYRALLLRYHRLVLDRADNRLERTTTAVETPLDGLHVIGPNRAQAHGYRPTPRRLVTWVLDGLDVAFEHTTFVDIGSGRGRVLFEAARYPFQNIIGIECTEELHEDASLNLRHWPRAIMRCREVDLVLGDAFETPLPDGDLLIWMFDPFSDRLMTRMAARLAEHARNGRVTLVLIEPQNPMAFRESTAFREVTLKREQRRRIARYSPYPVAVFQAGSDAAAR